MYSNDIASLRLQLELGVEYCVNTEPSVATVTNGSALWSDRANTMLTIMEYVKKINALNKPNASPIEVNIPSQQAIKSPAESINIAAKKAYEQASNAKNIEELRSVVENFYDCKVRTNMTKTVFADGQVSAKVMLVGEAPGEQEDKSGIPFCGRSGMLLDKMLNNIGLSRTSNIYITNVVFWRPPANRKPTNDEIAICQPFLHKHIALINPAVIIACGSTAVEALIEQTHAISKICGHVMQHNNIFLKSAVNTIPIFHPSYLMRNPIAKKQTWFHLLNIAKHLAGMIDQ